MNSIVEYYPDHKGHKCGYCKSPNTNFSHGLWAHRLTVADYQKLIDRGWRRSGKYCYKPTMDMLCCPMYTIRCRTLEFKTSKSQKKILKTMNKFLSNYGTEKEIELESPKSETSDTGEDVESGGDQFVEATRVASHVDLDAVVIDTEVDVQSVVPEVTSTAAPSESTISNVKVKNVKPGIGLDANKGPCKKAKQIRLERKLEKLKRKGIDVDMVRSNKNVEKRLEYFFNEIPNEVRNKLEVRLVRTSPPSAEWLASAAESHRIYRLYQMTVHGDPEHKCSEPKFHDFLVASPLVAECPPDGPPQGYGSFHQQYWLNGRMLATGVVDVLPSCVSSVYFFYDPQYRHLTFGTYGALREIAFTRELQKTCPDLKYYYMGFYIHSCRKMRYKGNFQPSDLLCPETYKWFPIQDCIPKIDASPYSRLNPDLDAVDENRCTRQQIDDVLLLINPRTAMTLGDYRKSERDDKKCTESVKEYAQLVGAAAAKRLILQIDKCQR